MLMGAAAATTEKKGVQRIHIDWKKMFSDSPEPAPADVTFLSTPPSAAGKRKAKGNACARSSPDSLDVCIVSPPSAPANGARRRRREEEDEEYSGRSIDGLRRDIETMPDHEVEQNIQDLHPSFGGLLSEQSKRPLELFQDEARRRGIRTGPAKDGGECYWATRSRAEEVYRFDDEQTEDDSRKYFQKSPTIRSTKKNYGSLGVMTRARSNQYAPRRPIAVDKMYSNNTSPTALHGNTLRVRAVDPKEHDNAKSRHNYETYAKRRKEHHEDISLLHQKVGMLTKCRSSITIKVNVVLLDDEDVQPDEPVDSALLEKWKDIKIYYPPSDDPEAVELSSSDIRCLNPGVYLSSPVINYYIQYIKRAEMHVECGTNKFYMFNTYFYSKLQEALLDKAKFLKLRRWWKGVNIFQRGYIILPIHGTSHWSLIIVCMPAKEGSSGPIILHLDSLGMHPSDEIFDTVGRYLEEEWLYLRKNFPSDILISDTRCQDLPRNIQKVKLEVPGQNNAYDCGIFMLFYIQRFIGDAPERFTRDSIDMFGRSWFRSEATSGLRSKIREQLLKLFENARVDDVMPEAGAPDGPDEECIMKEGETEATVTPCGSSGMAVAGGDASTHDEEDFMEVKSRGGTPSTTRGSDGMIRDCALSEAATLSDTMEGDGAMKTDCVSSKTEQDIEILPPDRPKHSEEVIIQSTPDLTMYSPDSCDSDMEEVKTPETARDIELLPSDRPKHNEEIIIQSTPDHTMYCPDSCDSDVEEVKIPEVEKRRHRDKWCAHLRPCPR